MKEPAEKLIHKSFKEYKKLHTAKYGCVFRDKLIGFVEEGKITVEDVIEIFDTLSDIDDVRKNDESTKRLLFSVIENSSYSSSILDTLYKWQYVK